MSPTIIEKLLKGAEVEWKPLWKVTIWDKKFNGVEHFKQPKTIKYHYLLASELKALAIPNGSIKLLTTSTTNYWTSEKLAKNKINNGEIVAIPWGGDINVQYYNGKFITADNRILTSVDKEFLDNKYLYYFFDNNYRLLKSFYRGSGIKHPNMAGILDILVPIPPLSVQKEIVRILDAFTAHTAELTAELNERKKQYNYYRDKLLTFSDEEVEWKTLGDIGEVRMCKRILKHQTSENGDVPFYKIGTFGKRPDAYISRELFNDYKKKYNYPKIGEVLISASGTIGRTVIFDGSDAYFQDSNIVWIENDESQVLNKYLFYYYKIAKWGASEGGTIARLYNDNLRKVAIPIPTLAEQQRIVDILDKFDALTTSITQGLPREIELRQKQYEYYRDQLLNFPKPENDAIKHNSTNR